MKKWEKGFIANLEEETRKKMDFRRVLYTGKFIQLVLMCLKPKEDIGEEVHDTVDLFFRFEGGEGVILIYGNSACGKRWQGCGSPLRCGTQPNQHINYQNLKLSTIYSPPEHMEMKYPHNHETPVNGSYAVPVYCSTGNGPSRWSSARIPA